MSNNTSKNENGTSHVNIGSMPSGSNEQVIAQALSTFALQVPSTVQSSLRGSSLLIITLLIVFSLMSCGLSAYFYYSIKEEVKQIHILFEKVNDRHQRMTQFAKEQDYRILTKESR